MHKRQPSTKGFIDDGENLILLIGTAQEIDETGRKWCELQYIPLLHSYQNLSLSFQNSWFDILVDIFETNADFVKFAEPLRTFFNKT